MKLRLLLASFVQDVRHTGMGRWAHESAAALRDRGDDVTLWFADDFPAMRPLGRLAVLAHPIAFAARFCRMRDRFDVALIHEASGYWATALRRAGAPLPAIVSVCHNVESHHQAQMRAAARRGLATVTTASRIKTALFRRWQSDGSIRRGDAVICLSSLDREYIVSRLGLSAASVRAIVNGFDAAVFHPREAPDACRVLFVGGWLDVKGRRLLPAIWRAVREASGPHRLTLLGTGAPPDEVIPAFDARDRETLTVIPRLEDPAAVAATMARHDVLLMPSLSEGSPLSLLEAMATGLVPVAARVGGIPDIVLHGRNGLLFDPEAPRQAAELILLLSSPSSPAAELSRAARKDVERFSWHAVADAIHEVAEQAVHESRARAYPHAAGR